MDKNILSNMLYGILIGIKYDCENCINCKECKYYLKPSINGHNCKIAALGDELKYAPSDWDFDCIRKLIGVNLPKSEDKYLQGE